MRAGLKSANAVFHSVGGGKHARPLLPFAANVLTAHIRTTRPACIRVLILMNRKGELQGATSASACFLGLAERPLARSRLLLNANFCLSLLSSFLIPLDIPTMSSRN